MEFIADLINTQRQKTYEMQIRKIVPNGSGVAGSYF